MKRLLILFLLLPTVAWAGDAYFVKKGGNDASNGQSWATAWATPERADTTITTGDTVIFGTGKWLNVHIDPQTPNAYRTSPRPWTVYACSSWYADFVPDTAGGAAAAVAGITTGGVYRTRLYSGTKITPVFVSVQGDGDSVYRAYYNTNAEDAFDWEYGCVPGGSNCGWIGAVTQGWADSTADSMLVQVATYAQLTQKGEQYYAASADSVYFIPYGNTVASRFFMASDNPVVAFTPENATSDTLSHIRFWGLELKMGKQGAVYYVTMYNAVSDSTFFEHCDIGMGGSNAGNNPGAIACYAYHGCFNRFNVVRSCRLGWALHPELTDAVAPPWNGFDRTGNQSRGGCIIAYSMQYWHIDSCTIKGPSAIGVLFKNDDYGGQNVASYTGCKVTNSYITGAWDAGVCLGNYPDRNSVYGNIIDSCYQGILLETQNSGIDTWFKWKSFFGNNTIYNCWMAPFYWVHSDGGGGTSCLGDSNKYVGNIVMNKWAGTGPNADAALWTIHDWHECPADYDTTFKLVDYNMWYNESSGYTPFYVDAPTRGGTRDGYHVWSYWQAKGWDVHGSYGVDPDFDSVNAADPWAGFFRSNAPSSEMNMYYGGRLWTKFGAVQDASEPPANQCPVVSLELPVNASTVTSLPTNIQLDITDADNDQVVYWIKRGLVSPPTVEVYRDTVTAPALNQTFSNTGLLNDTTYYWRVYYNDTTSVGGGAGTCVDSTSVMYFHTDTTTIPATTVVRKGVLIKPGGPE